jgi:hypothetical protein
MKAIIEKMKSYLPYIAGLILVSCIIFYPELQGKKLGSHDSVSNEGAAAECNKYLEQGDNILWTNRVFSGMPTYNILGKTSNNNLIDIPFYLAKIFPYYITFFSIILLSMFFALLLLRIDKRIAFLLTIAFGLNVWVLDSLWAAHLTKMVVYGFLSVVVSSFIAYILYGGYLRLLSLAIGLSMCIGFNHIQITYYGAILCLIIGVYFFINAILTKTSFYFFKKIGFVLIAVTIAILSNISLLFILQDYNKDTMRGGKTELVKPEANSTAKEGGLDINYAFNWSYNTVELFNFFIPNAVGGSSSYKTTPKKSKLSEAIGNEVLPIYWGGQPFTGGPNYLGASIVFLAIFSLFYWNNRMKYAFLIAILLSMAMGLGKYFIEFNEILFNYLPFYNKFRTPTMSFSILNMTTIVLIGLAFQAFISDEENSEHKLKSWKYSIYTMLGLFVLAYITVSNSGYTYYNDAQTFGENNKAAIDLITEDRISFFKSDFIRSFFIICVIAASLFFYIKNKVSQKKLILVLGVFVAIEMWGVATRYLNTDTFEKTEKVTDLIPNAPYNTILEQDKTHFRVFNTTNQSVFNDNTEGFRFSNVGGYSPAKLYRYQDLIDVHLSKGNMPVLNMLNTKYIIINNQGQPIPQTNPDACGNAWFINEVKFAKNANEEMDSIGTFNPKNTVWIDQRYKSETNFNINTDPNASISLSKYHPENMEYTSKSSTGGFVVFSEIWYRGNEDWNLYVNGKPQKLVRVNYILRGAYIPAGNNKIEMKFTSKKLDFYLNISLIATIVLVLGSIIVLYLKYKQTKS